MQNIDKLLYKELKDLEDDYKEPIEIGEGLLLNYKQDVIKPVTYYIHSRYLNGDEDEFGEKPFMNEVNANSTVSKTATDFDTKDIRVESDDGEDYAMSMTFNKEIYDWMKTTNFAKTLNEMNSTRIDYGEALVKKTEQMIDGEKTLKIEVPAWENLEVDASNILGRPIIETHYLTPAELAEKSEIWENVRDVLKEIKNNEEADDYIKVKEITGKFPKAVYLDIKDEGYDEVDEYTYEDYRFFVACIGEKKIYLYCEELDETPYKLLSWEKRAKRPAVGVVEQGIPAQIWTNDVIQKEHRWFELASKWIGQSASRSLKGRNLLTELENGTVLEHDDGKPVTRVDLVASAVPEFQNLIEKWSNQFERATSTYDAVRGETPPSGQAFRLQALVQQQSSSIFDQKREEMGIFITELFNDWILPHIASKLNREHILASEYSAEELDAIDKHYANNIALRKVKEAVLNDELMTIEEYEGAKQAAIDFISQTKEKRFLEVPKNYYKDFKPKITIVTTGEQRNKMATMETLYNLLTAYLSNPEAVKNDPVASQLFSKIVEISGGGISPVSLGLGQNNAPAQAVAPQMQGGVPPQPKVANTSSIPNPANLAPEAVQNDQ